GTDRADFSRPPNGAPSHRTADFTSGAGATAGCSSNLEELDSVISSKRFLAAAAVVPLSADLADVKRPRSAVPMWKRTSWLRWKKLSTAQPGRFHCGVLV